VNALPPEDWQLVLEFVKALAAPTAAVIAVVTAARLALRSFRYQKLLERRLDWYEAMLTALSNAYLAYARTIRENRHDTAEDEAIAAIRSATELATKATLYADASGVTAMHKWVQEAVALFGPFDPTPESFARFEAACGAAGGTLTTEMRRDLGVRALPRLPTMLIPVSRD
jgi:hypothetical protein